MTFVLHLVFKIVSTDSGSQIALLSQYVIVFAHETMMLKPDKRFSDPSKFRGCTSRAQEPGDNGLHVVMLRREYCMKE